MINKWIKRIELQDYFDNNNEFYIRLHMFLESESDSDECYSNLNYFIEYKKIKENRDEFRTLLRLLSKISNNHHLSQSFETNVKRILNDIKDDIINTFTNFEIFRIFKNNKRFLLFLFGNKTIIPDSEILIFIINYSSKEFSNKSYYFFFYPEIKSFIDNEFKAAIENYLYQSNYKINENFEEKRLIGENDSLLCKLLREDLIDQFITYSSQSNLNLSSHIKHSIFETHSFLLKNNPTIIEYAAFFGSINIVKYLFLHDVELEPSLWLYAIHSKNADLIHFLEENHVEPEDQSYYECFQETVKCHHIDLSQYIQENYMNYKNEIINENNFDTSIVSFSFRFYNFAFFPRNFYNFSTLLYACQYDYLTLVKILMKTQHVNLSNRYNNDDEFDIYKISAEKNNYEIINFLLAYEGSCIRDKLLYSCKNLMSLTIPSNIIIIKNNVFSGCSSLTQIKIPSSVKTIGIDCFYNCTSLVKIEIPSSVTIIGDGCFSGCSSLTQIKIPTSITSIGSYTFSGCSSLKEIEIPTSVTSIGSHAFAECSSLKEIEIPPFVTKVGVKAFYKCFSLARIVIHSPLTTFEKDALAKTLLIKFERPYLKDIK